MPGKGKYGQYGAKQIGSQYDAKNKLMALLYPEAPYAGLDETAAREKVLNTSGPLLTSGVQNQAGPHDTLGGMDIDMNYIAAPDLKDVKWTKPGDPVNPYVPDTRSPLGGSDAEDKVPDPGTDLAEEVYKPNYVPGSIQSPSTTSPKIAETSDLSLNAPDLTPGKSKATI